MPVLFCVWECKAKKSKRVQKRAQKSKRPIAQKILLIDAFSSFCHTPLETWFQITKPLGREKPDVLSKVYVKGTHAQDFLSLLLSFFWHHLILKRYPSQESRNSFSNSHNLRAALGR
jgi:hypothetical protein